MKTLLIYTYNKHINEFLNWGISFEFKLQDFWVGVYWDSNPKDCVYGFDIWFCIIPCFPIHYWSGRIKGNYNA